MHCLDEKGLSLYLDERISENERRRIEAHVAVCRQCLDFLLVAYEAQGLSRACPPLLKERIKRQLGLRQAKPRTESRWFFLASLLFVLSFVFRRYFLQFLAASVIVGFKWAMEGEGARRAIMIFRGIEKKEKRFEPRTRYINGKNYLVRGERKSPPILSDMAGGDKHDKAR